MIDAGRRSAAAVAVLFFLKAAVLALFVTPLWDVPDEVGHFAYAADIADGRGILPPGHAVVPGAVVGRWRGQEEAAPVPNWIAIHPPGYHIFAAAALAGARRLTPDFEWQVRLTRLTSSIFGAATIWLLYELLLLAGAGAPAALAGAAAVGSVPMFSHMASGVNHDTASAALGVVCAIAWVDVLRRKSVAAALRLSLALAAAGLVKATIAPAAVVMMAILPAWLPGRRGARIARAAGFSLVALSTTVWWVARLGRVPAPEAAPGGGRAGAAAFFEAFRRQPIADHALKNFLGLIGWTGGGGGVLRWFQISGLFLGVYLLAIFGIVVLAAAWSGRRDSLRPLPGRRRAAARWILAGAVFLVTFGWMVSRPATNPLKLFLESLIFSLPFLAALRFPTPDPEEDIVSSSRLVCLGFMLLFFWNVSRLFLLTGEMHGAHGRYYFAVLGFVMLAFYLPAADFLRGWAGRNRALAAAVVVLWANEAAFFAFRVVPFYRQAAAGRIRP
ncbi:MAG TPA: hypothetical protein VFS34_00625 [Thermoanaerobaculia bacterium]|nr:hypothetical protein [Thermoanaerobaculia bacterium]